MMHLAGVPLAMPVLLEAHQADSKLSGFFQAVRCEAYPST